MRLSFAIPECRKRRLTPKRIITGTSNDPKTFPWIVRNSQKELTVRASKDDMEEVEALQSNPA